MKFLRILMFVGLGSILSASSCSPESGSEDGNGGGTPPKSNLKIMSFNVRANTASDIGERNWDSRREVCIAMIEDIAPDVIAMQEPRTAQRTYIKENLLDYAFLEIEGTGDGKGGNTALLYNKDRFTQLDWGFFYLSATPDIPSTPWGASEQWHGSVWVQLKENTTEKEFWCLSTHLPSQSIAAGQQARVNGAKLNVERMSELAGDDATVFIGGDMNCSYDAGDANRGALDAYYRWGSAARAITPAGDAPSFNNYGNGAATPKRNIDHIFYRNAVSLSFRTISDKGYGVEYISDHYPILLTALF